MTSLRVAARERSYFPLAVSDLDHGLRDVETVPLGRVLALPFRGFCASETVPQTPACSANGSHDPAGAAHRIPCIARNPSSHAERQARRNRSRTHTADAIGPPPPSP